MRKLVVTILTLFLLLIGTSSVFAAEFEPITDRYENIGIVQCPKYLNIRKRPKQESDVVGVIASGGVCEVIQEGKTWCAVRSGEISGYVLKEYLLTGDEAVTEADRLAYMQVKLVSPSVVYAGMSRDDKVWERPGIGVVYDVLNDYGDWLEVDLLGTSGYIPVDDNLKCFYGLPTASPTYSVIGVSETRQAMVKYAMTFLGNQYVWGGNDPHTGADCSGFVRYIYNKYRPDIYLPRTSYTQCYYGEKISSLDMRPGDLLFYAYDNGTVHHVAMYIGNGTIVHAASRKQGIILSPWNYQTPKYIRNILND